MKLIELVVKTVTMERKKQKEYHSNPKSTTKER